MVDLRFEPTNGEIMREPMVRALMRADRVDARAFEARLRLMADGGERMAAAAEVGDPEDGVAGRGLPLALSRPAVEHRCWG